MNTMVRDDLVILDGLHAVKHAVRFGAEIVDVMELAGAAAWRGPAADLAADVVDAIGARVRTVDRAEFEQWSKPAHPTGLVAVARRPRYGVDPRLVSGRRDLMGAEQGVAVGADGVQGAAPVILLEQPRHPGNAGAVVRVAAAAGASGVLMYGDLDPWNPAVVRAAAGLHFALPVMRVAGLDELEGPLIALDPDGEDVRDVALPAGAVMAFGTERDGLSDELLARADRRVKLPMRAGVSSLNLATSVAATLYWWRMNRN